MPRNGLCVRRIFSISVIYSDYKRQVAYIMCNPGVRSITPDLTQSHGGATLLHHMEQGRPLGRQGFLAAPGFQDPLSILSACIDSE